MKTVDVCVIGAGSGGLSVAAAASQMGANVVLIEEELMGGDCLNYGCVPSKSLLSAAKAAQNFRTADEFGIRSFEPEIDFAKVMAHVHGVIKTLSVNDSVERFTKLGVHVIKEKARFISPHTVQAGEEIVKARRFVIATGSKPAIPPIPGLDKTSFYTNENIFALQKKPEHLLIIGGGPIGCELAQAFAFLGSKVTILEAVNILPHDDQELVGILREQFIKKGIQIDEGVKIKNINQQQDQIQIIFEKNDKEEMISGSHVLVATGRQPHLFDLNLETAQVDYTQKGITVNAKLQTTNKHIYAIGDVVGSYQFTHVANDHAGIVIRNILFRLPAKVDYRAVPWVTFTEPELAHVGMQSKEASQFDPKMKILEWNFTENDRAQTEHQTIGKIKVFVSRKGIILGVNILGPHAGELLFPWILAVKERKSIKEMSSPIVPYPTLSEINKRVAQEFYKPLLFSKTIRRLVRFLSYFG